MNKVFKLIAMMFVVFFIPLVVMAESNGSIYVDENYIYENGVLTDYEVEGVTFDSNSKKLTLSNYNGGKIFIDNFNEEINVELIGENHILAPNDGNSFGLGLFSDASITGTGSLSIKHAQMIENTYDGASGILARGNIKLLGGKINVDGEKKYFQNAIYFMGDENIINGSEINLYDYCSGEYGCDQSYAIKNDGDLILNDGKVNINNIDGSGIYYKKSFYINGGILNVELSLEQETSALVGFDLRITGGSVKTTSFFGISAGSFAITGGDLKVVAKGNDDFDGGIFGNEIFIKGGKLDIECKVGLVAWRYVEISDGLVNLNVESGIQVWPSDEFADIGGGVSIRGGKTTINLISESYGPFIMIDKSEWIDEKLFPINLGDDMYNSDSSLKILENEDTVFLGNKDGSWDEEIQKNVYTTTKNLTISKYDYSVTSQNFNNINTSDIKDLIIKINGDYKKVTGIYIDGSNEPIDPKYYDIAEGSTILTLKSDYLKTLESGTHNVVVVYSNGKEVGTTFTIKKDDTSNTNNREQKIDNPKTGDNMVFYISMLGFSVVGFISTHVYLLKKI